MTTQRSTLDMLLLSDFGRLQPNRARAIAEGVARKMTCETCGREWPMGEMLCFTCNSYVGPAGRVRDC